MHNQSVVDLKSYTTIYVVSALDTHFIYITTVALYCSSYEISLPCILHLNEHPGNKKGVQLHEIVLFYCYNIFS